MFRALSIALAVSLAPAAWAEGAPSSVTELRTPEVAPTAPAQDGARLAEPEIPKSEPPLDSGDELNLGWTLVRTMVVLAMVVSLAWLTLNVGLRRLLGIRPVVGTSLVTVLERVPLDQKRSLFVVEAAGEVLLVGGGEGALSLLTRLDKAEVERLRSETSKEGPVQVSPLLQKLLGRRGTTPPAS